MVTKQKSSACSVVSPIFLHGRPGRDFSLAILWKFVLAFLQHIWPTEAWTGTVLLHNRSIASGCDSYRHVHKYTRTRTHTYKHTKTPDPHKRSAEKLFLKVFKEFMISHCQLSVMVTTAVRGMTTSSFISALANIHTHCVPISDTTEVDFADGVSRLNT